MNNIKTYLSFSIIYLIGAISVAQLSKLISQYDFFVDFYGNNSLHASQEVLIGIFGIAGMVGGIVLIFINVNLNKEKYYTAGVLIGAVSSFGILLNDNISYLYFMRILEGLSHTLIVVFSPAIIIYLSRDKGNSTLLLSIWGTFFSFGIILNDFIYSFLESSLLYLWVQPLLFIASLLVLKAFILKDKQANEFSIERYKDGLNKSDKYFTIFIGVLFFVYVALYIGYLYSSAIYNVSELGTYAILGNIICVLSLKKLLKRFNIFVIMWAIFSLMLSLIIFLGEDSLLAVFLLLGFIPVLVYSSMGYVGLDERSSTVSAAFLLFSGNLATFLAPTAFKEMKELDIEKILIIFLLVVISFGCYMISKFTPSSTGNNIADSS